MNKYHSFKVSDFILDFFAEEKSAAVEFQGNPAYFVKRTKDGVIYIIQSKKRKEKGTEIKCPSPAPTQNLGLAWILHTDNAFREDTL